MPPTRRDLCPSKPLRRRRAASWRSAVLLGAALSSAISSRALAAPGLDGTRNLGMGGATRASATGTNAMLVSPGNMGFTRQFLIDPVYQVQVENNTHGAGILAMDSLLNPRVAVGLGYIATFGGPRIAFTDETGTARELGMFHQGHEVGLALAINAVPGWLAFGVRPKFQYTSLRFLDPDNKKQDAITARSAFGLDLSMSISLARWVNIAVVGQNLAGPSPPVITPDLTPYMVAEGSLDRSRLSQLSDFPRTVAHGFALFPTRNPGFSFNFDGLYDFTSFVHQDKFVRMVFAGGAEYTIKNVVPLRFGGYWDSRGRGKTDDRGFIAFGLGFQRDAPKGGIGFDLGMGFSRQVTGPYPETRLGINLGLRINPN